VVFSCPVAYAAEQAPALPDRLEFESNLDASTLKAYSADASVTASPFARYYEAGPRIRLTGAETWYEYWGDPARTFKSKGRDTQGDLLLGHMFTWGDWSLTGLVGPTVLNSVQMPGDGSASSQTTKYGVKGLLSLYANPTPQTLLYAQGSVSTINEAIYAQAKYGFALQPKLFIGPEVSYSRGTTYTQRRVGVFLSGLKFGAALFSVSAGYVDAPDQGKGAYVGTSIRLTY
jgi:hypothetical protein